MDWEEKYKTGELPWDKGEPSLPLRQYLEHHPLTGKALIPGCGRGHEVALAVEQGIDAYGLDIAPTAVSSAQARYPHLKDRFVLGNLFDLPKEWHQRFDLIFEHTCMSALPPSSRSSYRHSINLLLKPGGLLIGVWYINPDLDPEHEGPPYPFPADELSALFKEEYEIIDDYIPEIAFPGREGRERLRVLRKQS